MWSGSKNLNAVLYSPNQKRMHSHVVLNTFWNALSCGPFQFQECSLMWSLPVFGMHSHIVPFNSWSAVLFSPHQFLECTLMWS